MGRGFAIEESLKLNVKSERHFLSGKW